jgi:hypothetical protein
MKNQHLERVANVFVGDWAVSITNQRWLEDKGTTTRGIAKGEWLGDAFVQLRAWFEGDGNAIFGDTAPEQPDDLGQPALHFVFGRSDARDRFVALSHDERGVLRVFDFTLDGDSWMLHREDPDFHQRLIGRVEGSRMLAHPDISEDEGATWVKDFDMTFTRVD